MLKVIFSGKVEKRNYTKGELNGPATITWQTGDVFEFSYKNGNMEVTSAVAVIIIIRVSELSSCYRATLCSTPTPG